MARAVDTQLDAFSSVTVRPTRGRCQPAREVTRNRNRLQAYLRAGFRSTDRPRPTFVLTLDRSLRYIATTLSAVSWGAYVDEARSWRRYVGTVDQILCNGIEECHPCVHSVIWSGSPAARGGWFEVDVLGPLRRGAAPAPRGLLCRLVTQTASRFRGSDASGGELERRRGTNGRSRQWEICPSPWMSGMRSSDHY